MKNKGLVLLIIFGLGLSLIFILSKDDSPRKRAVFAGDEAPPFEMKDLDGKIWRLSDLKGKVVLFNFWATWCDTCKTEKPFFNKLYESMKDNKDIVFLSVLYNDSIENARAYMQKNSFTFPVIEDSNRAFQQYGLKGVPETFVINKKGIVAQRIIGPMKWDSEEVKEAIVKLLKG